MRRLDQLRLFDIALAERPDHQQALIGLANQQLSQRLAENNSEWTLNLTASRGLTSVSERWLDPVPHHPYGEDWSVGIGLVIPLFDRSLREQRVRADIDVRQAENSLESLRQRISREVANRVRDIQIKRRQVDLSKRAREFAEQQLASSLADGVIVIDRDGTLLVVNPAARRLLGIADQPAVGQPFASVFVTDETLDELVQAVLDAVYHAETTHNRLLRLERPGAQPLALALTTSLLRDDAGRSIGAVALLNDITEREALRLAEQRLNAELSEANQALSTAYQTLETRNAELSALNKRVGLVRNLATGFVLLLFLGIGVSVWQQGEHGGDAVPVPAAATAHSAAPSVLRLEPQAHRVTLKLLGTLQPLAVVNLVAALEGTIAERNFDYGDTVRARDPLFTIAAGAAQVQYRDARSSYLTALEEVTRLESWAEGAEMQRAHRGLTRAKSSLKTLERNLLETRRLLELGIVAASELETLEEQLLAARMELAQAQEEVASTEARGSEDKLTVARLKLENARYSLEEWERKLD